jgi:hypothetical protein
MSGWLRVWIAFVLMLSVASPAVAGATPAPAEPLEEDGPQLYALVAAALPPGTHRAAPRLAAVRVNEGGQATVVFAIRGEEDDAEATRAGAVADTLTALRTVYQSPTAERLTSLTVLGTFPFKSTKGKVVREGVVLRAVVSTERAAELDWQQLTPDGLESAVDVWWMQEAFARAESAVDE